MIEKRSISDQRIIDCLISEYGIDTVTLTILPIGADINASVYKAQSIDQHTYFIKLKWGHHPDIGVEIVELLLDAGIQQVIPPIQTRLGQLFHRLENFIIIVYPFVDGQNGFSRDLTDDHWFKLGKAMRQVHEIDVPQEMYNKLRKEDYSPKWREVVRSLYAHIEAEHNGDEIALKLSKYMRENLSKIQRLVDRAEQLAKKVQNQSPRFVLCHSDIHGGNVLIPGNDTLYIVDWDDPIMAPKERDLMFIGGGVANVWNKRHEEESFYRGYGSTNIDSTILAYYRHERIVEDIAVYAQELLLKPTAGEDRDEMYKQFIDMFEPRGVVDIAFETDKLISRIHD